MTTETATEAHALIDELAAMTVACPLCYSSPEHRANEKCTGTIPRFPSAWRKCWCATRQGGKPGYLWAGAMVAWPNCPEGYEPCGECNGTGEVPNHDVRIEGLMAELTRLEAEQVFIKLINAFCANVEDGDPMPPDDEIRLAGLRAIAEVVGVTY